MNRYRLFYHCIYISIICLFLFCPGKAKSQISEGGKPVSFNYQNPLKSWQPAVQIPVNFSVEDRIAVDEWRVSQGAPLAVSALIDTDLNMENAGEWRVLPSGERIWQLRLQAKGAIALMLYYETFYLPEGGKLFIYNAEKTHLLGAYTSQTNPDGKSFATEFVAGDDIILEYEPPVSDEKARIAINQVGYGYNHLHVTTDLRSTGPETSGSCMVNINCEEGEEWQNEKNGVCMMIEKIGTAGYLCSGSLVNNTAKDMKPYILSAFHCTQDYDNGTTASETDLNQWVFYFHFEHTGCENASPIAGHKTMTGCRRIVSIPIEGGSDGLLLLLNDKIPAEYNVYFNGWDRSETAASSGVNIHHPSGDYMKISTFGDHPVKTTTWIDNTFTAGAPDAHWNVIFDKTTNGHSITEGGSSGSPLFNENKQIVGTLTGGNSTCRLTNGNNLYGKFSFHWDKYSRADTGRMDIWLDPLNTGATTIPGLSQTGEEGSLFNYKSPTSVTAQSISSNNVLIQWNAPVYTQLIGWGTQNSAAQIGYHGTPFYFGQRWESQELINIHKKKLVNVKFIPVYSVNYAIFIKQGERTYQQEITNLTANRSNTIELKTPYTIDANQDLIISIYARKYGRSVYPAFVDNGPAINGKGNLVSFDGNEWEYLLDEEFNINFILSATVTSEEGELTLPLPAANSDIQIPAFPAITGYNIYKDQMLLASVATSTLQYTDKNVTGGKHDYSVSALYDSKESRAATATAETNVNTESIQETTDFHITPAIFKDRIQINNYQQVKNLEIYSSDGKLIRKLTDPAEWIETGNLPQGVYFFKLSNDKTFKTVRGIKQ